MLLSVSRGKTLNINSPSILQCKHYFVVLTVARHILVDITCYSLFNPAFQRYIYLKTMTIHLSSYDRINFNIKNHTTNIYYQSAAGFVVFNVYRIFIMHLLFEMITYIVIKRSSGSSHITYNKHTFIANILLQQTYLYSKHTYIANILIQKTYL